MVLLRSCSKSEQLSEVQEIAALDGGILSQIVGTCCSAAAPKPIDSLACNVD